MLRPTSSDLATHENPWYQDMKGIGGNIDGISRGLAESILKELATASWMDR